MVLHISTGVCLSGLLIVLLTLLAFIFFSDDSGDHRTVDSGSVNTNRSNNPNVVMEVNEEMFKQQYAAEKQEAIDRGEY